MPGLVLVGAMVAMFWAVEVVDRLAFDGGLDRHGIVPRRVDGLDGVLYAPFLHASWSHLIANTVPFVVLGVLALVVCRTAARWLVVTLFVVVAGGVGTWLAARGGIHLGASGLVFGYLGFVVTAAIVDRSVRAVLAGVVAAVLYGGMLWGLLPRTGLSFEGHAFGLLAGMVAAVRFPRTR